MRLFFALLALIASSQAVGTSEMPDAVKEQYALAGQVLIDSIVWPDADVGFKTLTLGGRFDTAGPGVISFIDEGDSMNGKINHYECKLVSVVPVLTCKLHFWNGKQNFSPELQELGSAFGEDVEVGFKVILDTHLSLDRMKRREFGTGRISMVQVVNRHPTPDFVRKATDYFSKKFGAAPFIRRTSKHPEEIYSQSCVKTLAKTREKPLSDLSAQDLALEKLCEAEAFVAITNGKGVSEVTTIRSWSDANNRYDVTIQSTETRDGTTGLSLAERSFVAIATTLNTTSAEAAYMAQIEKIKKASDASQQTKAEVDF